MKFSALAVLVSASCLVAQQAPPTPPPAVFGQVSGRVICGDTDQPGRFAAVQLIGEKPAQTNMADLDAMGKNPDVGKAFAVVLSSMLKDSGLSTLSTIDGTFTLDKVPPGTYYVVAQLPGYESPLSRFSQAERMKSDPATMKAIEAEAEKVVVQANQPAHVDVRLERGASLSGVIKYDDGSPAPGVTSILMEQQPDGAWKDLSINLVPTPTDDLGRFRFYGLLPGKYAVKAALPTMQASVGLGPGSLAMHMDAGDALVVYSGGVLRPKDVKPIDVGPGDSVDGVELTFPIGDLHKINGTVVAKADGHAVNFGTVSLLDPDSKTQMRTALIGRDGTFHFNYVPDGQYTLQVAGAADTEASGSPDAQSDFARLLNSKPVKVYAPLEQPLLLKGDAPDLTLQVSDAAPKPPGAS